MIPAPQPGSDAARARGCTCPDNDHGQGVSGTWITEDGVDLALVYLIDGNCPIHVRVVQTKGDVL